MEVEPGDVVKFHCLDSSGGQLGKNSTVDDFLKIDRNKIHTLTGPVAIKGAQPGDTLRVDVVNIQLRGWGWTSITPGLGFLPDRFPDPFLFIWQLDEESTDSLSPAVVPLRPFCGVMGVAPAAPGEMRTRPPGEFGGNMDAPEVSVGNTLYLPVNVSGALFYFGDGHAAMGDGEIAGSAIEVPMRVRLQFDVVKGKRTGWPRFENEKEIMTTGIYRPVDDAVRIAFTELVAWIHADYGLSELDAYELLSKVAKIHLTEMVDPNYVVVASVEKKYLPKK